MTCTRAHVGVGLVLSRADGAVLMHLRKGGYQAGVWAFPGGNHDVPEQPEETALREFEEETGLSMANVGSLTLTHSRFNCMENRNYITLYYEARYYAPEGDPEPRVMEPEKCGGWKWTTAEDRKELPMMVGCAGFFAARPQYDFP